MHRRELARDHLLKFSCLWGWVAVAIQQQISVLPNRWATEVFRYIDSCIPKITFWLYWFSYLCLPQLCCYCLWLCQLPQADLWEGRLSDWVLLSLQTDMASKPDLRYGPSAKGSDSAGTDEARLRPQLWTGIWTRYELTTFSLASMNYVREARKEIHLFCSTSWNQRVGINTWQGVQPLGTDEGHQQYWIWSDLMLNTASFPSQ